ncbi:MAG TPA: non-heme iron oxygenase ferredoxin subunit [Spirochaetia bacterium]|nr:non-heme iron oxygenase ferredoxin subunit [Spirochaetia bacterium]
MAEWVRVASDGDLKGQMRVQHGENAYALFRLEDQVYALDDICSHEYSRLSEGDIFRGQVACPKHGSRFDIKTGKVTGFPATKPVHTYPVKVEEGEIFIQVEDEEW